MTDEWIATVNSINHWKNMVERMKWLMESAFTYEGMELLEPKVFIGDKAPLFYVLNTTWRSRSCALCHSCRACEGCPLHMIGLCCDDENSPWRVTTKVDSLIEFIENAEAYMIPVLERAKKWCEEQGEV